MRILKLATWLVLALSACSVRAEDLNSKVIGGGDNDAHQCFNVTIVGDGWTGAEDEGKTYEETCAKLASKLMETKPLSGYKRLFRFTRVDAWSDDHGVSVEMPDCAKEAYKLMADSGDPALIAVLPRKSLDHVTHFKSKIVLRDDDCCHGKRFIRMTPEERLATIKCASSSEGQLVIPDTGLALIRSEALKDATPDIVLFITPDDDWHAAWADSPDKGKVDPGSSFTLIAMTLYQMNEKFGDIVNTFAHEVGHACFKLGDEYSNDPPKFCTKPALEYGDPANLTIDLKHCKWQHLIDWGTVKEPVPGGGRACKSDVWHPQVACRMGEHPADEFCPVCLERIAHGAGERSHLIKASGPGGASVDAKSNDTLKFFVDTMPMEDPFGEYAYSWTLDSGTLETGTLRYPQKTYFEKTIGPLSVGLHILSFEVQDRRRASTDPGAVITARVPVATRYWRINVRSNCTFWKFGCEDPKELKDDFLK